MKDLSRVSSIPRPELPERWRSILQVVVVLGVLTIGAGLLVDPARAGGNYLLALFFLLSLGLSGLLLIAFQRLTNASWGVAFRRVPEGLVALLPVVAVLSLGLFALIPVLYHWSHPEEVESDAILLGKSGWLSTGFFIARTVICCLLWLFFAYAIVTRSRRQTAAPPGGGKNSSAAPSAAFIVVFAVGFSVISFDWLMSLEPHWFSTIFAVYNFSGLFLSGLAVTTLFAILLRRMGPFRGVVRDDHLHDLGKLMLGFSVFWAYIWFCQYMLIWYGNMPEETSYFFPRQQGTWGLLFVLNLFLNWIIPFLVLLPRPAKRNENILFNIALLLLAGRWLDLYLMVLPPLIGDEPKLGVLEIAPFAAALALAALVFFRSLRKCELVPVGDPLLEESLHHQQ